MKHGPQHRAVLDARVTATTHAGAAARKGRRAEAAAHDVAMDLQVLRRRADVDPVAAYDVGDEGLAALDQRREIAALDRSRRVLRDPVEGARLQDVDAGVDRVLVISWGAGFSRNRVTLPSASDSTRP